MELNKVMKKTNLRINNFFVFQKDEKYYLTDIDVLDDWKNTDNKKLNDFIKDNDITDKLKELIKSYGINANINVILSDFKKYKKSLEKGENKVISLKKGGSKNIGWQLSGGAPEKSSWQIGGSPEKSSWQMGGAPETKWQ